MKQPDCIREPCDGFAELYHKWERATTENARLRAALEWYAADHTPEQMVWDDGMRARHALNGLKE